MEENKNVYSTDKTILRAMKIGVEYQNNKEVLRVRPIARNKGLEIQPATSVDENLPTFDVPANGYRVEDSKNLQELGMNSNQVLAHQNAYRSRVTDRANDVKREKAGQQQSNEPSRGE